MQLKKTLLEAAEQKVLVWGGRWQGMVAIPESSTLSAARPQVPNPTPDLPHGLPPLPQSLPQIPLQVSTVYYILPQTSWVQGPLVSLLYPPIQVPLDRGQAKDWRCSGAVLRPGDMSVGPPMEEQATTDGGLSSQLLSCPSLLGFILHSISCAWVDCSDTNHSRVSVCLATGTCPAVLHSVKVIKQI